jgi:cysteinyl-tRNA synthetase
LLTALNRFADTKSLESTSATPEARAEFQRGVVVLRELTQILGLFREPVTAAKGDSEALVNGLRKLLTDLGGAGTSGELPADVNGLMQVLISLRAEARKAKNYAMADQIRKRLSELNVTLEDRAGGTGWRVG